MMQYLRWTIASVVFCCSFHLHVTADEPYTLRVQLEDTTHVGSPLFWNDSEMTMLARDGQLVKFDPRGVRQAEKVSDTFAPYSFSEMQSSLMAEFGNGFEVSATGTYLVVHPVGEARQWAGKFEELYRSLNYYFATRGIDTHASFFPLVAVVFPDENAFRQHAQQTQANVPSDWVGYYSNQTNRIYLYDYQRYASDAENTSISQATLFHEAAHQTAYNIGIHNRWGGSPTWIVEGIGTMFEARGIYDSSTYSRLIDKINPGQLEAYAKLFPNGLKKHTLTTLITDDKAFRRSGDKAYAIAWALTFMLAEEQPMELSQYLQRTASRKPFSTYSSAERLRDFTEAIGDDFDVLRDRLTDFTERALRAQRAGSTAQSGE